MKKAMMSFLIVMLLLSLYRFYNTGIKQGVRIANHPKGDFIGAYPTYWAWKLNPALITQNHTVIDAMNLVCSPDFSKLKPPMIEKICRDIDKYDFPFNAADNTIERVNELLRNSKLYDKLYKEVTPTPKMRQLAKGIAPFRVINKTEFIWINKDNVRIPKNNKGYICLASIWRTVPKKRFTPRAFYSFHYNVNHSIKILNRLLLEEIYLELPKMQEAWNYGPTMHFLLFPLIFLKSLNSLARVWLICCTFFVGFTIYLWIKILE